MAMRARVCAPSPSGRTPRLLIRRCSDAAIEVFEGVGKTMKAGNSAQAVFEATDPLPERGFQIYDSLAHGFGTDLLQPSIGISGSNYLAPPADFKYRENMVMVIQPNPWIQKAGACRWAIWASSPRMGSAPCTPSP